MAFSDDEEVKAMCLNYVSQVQTRFLESGGRITGDFRQFLHQLRQKNLHSSTSVVSALHTILLDHPDWLPAFKASMPATATASASTSATTAASEKTDDCKDCVDFLNRVGTRFGGDGVYRMFLECMDSYSRGEFTVSEVDGKVARLFVEHRDLAAEFRSFLPESYVQEGSSKMKSISPGDNIDLEITQNQESRNHDETETPAAPRRTTRRRTRNSGHNQEKEKAEPPPSLNPPRIVSPEPDEPTDFEMEDSLCYVEVQIGNLIATQRSAKRFRRHLLRGGGSSPADIEKHFSPLNLACIREMYGGRPEFMKLERELGEYPLSALTKLMKRAESKRETLMKSKARIQEKWAKIQRSRQ
ncbi:UNVERIFIED_CONTAM: hypothetical protein Slati_2122100 [Sesamum latifolium]|uniref:Histone deacetylase interacting domain-containing protein n=1 Tax=Sesamum latifolium TaxID=2727402 RepID=A0AAW2WQB9_9LAMI